MDSDYDVTFATYNELAHLDPDDLLTIDLLKQQSVRCTGAVWNDPKIDWHKAGLIVVRSTWDYHKHAIEFLRWVEQNASRICNSSKLIHWNHNKKYLLDLEEYGVKVVPTEIVNAGSRASIIEIAKRRGWSRVVLKPAIGLATSGVKLCSIAEGEESAQAHLSTLLQTMDALVQPFLPSVQEYGERALVFIDGKYSHSVRKAPFQTLAEAGAAGETAVVATSPEIAFGEKVLSVLDEVPLYARVDIVPDLNDINVLLELELIEPSLFLAFDSAAPRRFADAIQRRISAKSK